MPPRKPPPRRFQWHFLGGCITTYVNRPFPNLAGWASALRCCFRRTLGFLRHETTLKLKHLMVEWIRALIFYLQNGNISQEIFKMLRIFFGRCYLKRTWCVVWSCLKGTGTRNSWIHCFISITQDVTFSPTGVPSQFLYQRTRLQPHLYIIYIYISHTDILYSNMSKLTFIFWLCCDCILYMSSWFPEKIKTITVMSSYHVARFCKRLYGMIVCTICPVHCFAWLNANLRI